MIDASTVGTVGEMSAVSTALVHRRPRRPVADPGPDAVQLAPPPPLADAAGVSGWTYALFPVLGSAGLLVIALVNRNPLYLIAGGVFVLGSIGMGVAMWTQVRGRTQGQRFDARARYFGHLGQVRDRLREAARAQRESARTTHPEPAALLDLVLGGERVWERRPGDADFLHLRLGVARVPAVAAPRPGEPDPGSQVDPAAQEAAGRLVAAHAVVDDVPVAVPLHEGTTTLVGDPATTRRAACAMVAQLAALHAPDDVRIAVATPAGEAARAFWSFLAWLPHAHHPAPADGAGAGAGGGRDGGGGGDGDRLLLAGTAEELAALLGPELARRRQSTWQRGATQPAAAAAGPALVVVIDGAVGAVDPFADAADLGVAQLRLVRSQAEEPSHADLTLRLTPARNGRGGALVEPVPRRDDERTALLGATDWRADALGAAEAGVLARRLAPLQLSRQVGEVALSEISGLPELLGIDDVGALDPARAWARRPERQLLRVPLGVDAEGRPVELDLKESALSGMGPHGLVVGATGSGKSELLRTLVTGLALTHAPDELAMVLVDFKGGATFAGLTGLPHVAGSVTDLEDDEAAVERMAESLRGELRRREQLLRDSGGLASIREHRRRRLGGASVAPMPHLLVVIDEFSELLAQQPDLIDLFVTVGRLGRSLGVHLLLATQRLEEGRLRGLDSHLSYRLALRTFSAAESRAVIGNADAFELPPVPGSAYLKVDTSVYARLRVATVSAPYLAPQRRVVATDAAAPARPRPFPDTGDGSPRAPLPALGLSLSDPDQRSTLAVAVHRLAGAAPRVAPVWTSPLPGAVALATLVGPLALRGEHGEHGLGVAAPPGGLRVPLGLVDLPDRQQQKVFVLDLGAGGAHAGVVGAPQTGKTTLLRTLVTALAATRTPAEVQVYCLDLAGGGLTGLEVLPHVGGVASRRHPDLMRRTVAQLASVLDARERWFAEVGVDSPATLRARRAAGELGREDGGVADVVLVVDGWSVLRAEFEDLEQAVTALATRGAALGLHVVIATPRWFDLRPGLKDALGTKVELRLGDPADSVFGRPAARSMPADVPGRLLTAGDRRVQVALPQLVLPDAGGVAALADVGRAMAQAWPGPPAPPVRLLPLSVSARDLADGLAQPGSAGLPVEPGVAFGVREADGAPARLDLTGGPDPHLLVVGDAASGKTTALRTLARAMTAESSPDELLVVVVDYRRTLLDAVGEEHLSQYCASAPAAAGTLAALAERLAARLPGPEVTREQLLARTWWTGPRALVVVDDHDLVAAPSGDPVAALLELLPLARDVGLHLVLARSGGGAATAMTSSVVRRLRELGTPGLLLSGSREEGPVLHGVRMQPLPPGRALLATRRRAPQVVQVAQTEDDG